MTNTYTTYTTLTGNVIITNETGTHCYMWPEGRKGERVRIKKTEYEQIIREDKLERKMVAEQEAAEAEVEAAIEAVEESETTEETKQIAKAMDEATKNPEIPVEQFCKMVEKMNREQNERNEFTNISKEDVVDAILSENKKKRTRKSKDIAYDGNGITLTAKQVDFIRHLPDTCFWERGLDSALWTDVLADEIGGQFAGKPMTTGAMISTICEKGLANRAADRVNGRKATFMVLTELGKKVAAELGLN